MAGFEKGKKYDVVDAEHGECVERINLEKERVDYDRRKENRRSCKILLQQ